MTMKAAKQPAAAPETAPSRRSQPVRQTRTNPPRTSASSRAGRDGRNGTTGAASHGQPIDIFPGVVHFTDAISALPKELVKHFTLLKEVDAKIHVPQQALFQLIDTALRIPPPNTTRSPYDGRPVAAPISAPMTAQNSSMSSAAPANGQRQSLPPSTNNSIAQLQATDDAVSTSAFDPSNLPRRQLFRQVAIEIKEMLVALEEKNHVISTANDALNKQLSRIDDIWPHLEAEFSEEAKYGSATHWAYPENRAASRANNTAQAERSRREGAANLSAAAQQIAEEAAARSDARKQAVAARRNQRNNNNNNNNNHDSDADDHAPKRSGGSKSRKAVPAPDPSAGVGLGISGSGLPANGTTTATSSSKRRKTEKPATGGAPMERALSGVFGSSAGGSKAKTASPRQSPAPDGSGAKKRKALPSGGNQAKKSRNTASATSSPVIGALPDSAGKAARGSPVPTNLSTGNSAYEAPAATTANVGPAASTSTHAKTGLANEVTTESLVVKDKNGGNSSKPAGDSQITTGNSNSGGAEADVKGADAGNKAGNSEGSGGGSGTKNSNSAGTSTNISISNSNSTSNNNSASNSTSNSNSNSTNTSTATPDISAVSGKDGGSESKDERDSKVPAGDGATPGKDQNSAPNTAAAETGKQRPSPLALTISTQSNGGDPAAPVAAAAPPASSTNGSRATAEAVNKDAGLSATPAPAATSTKAEALKVEAADSPPASAVSTTASKKDVSLAAAAAAAAVAASKTEEVVVPKKESTPARSVGSSSAGQPQPVTTKSGRASKPSTPSIGTFAEASRVRPSRATESVSSGGGKDSGTSGSGSGSGNGGSVPVKRSHKKGASISSQAHAQAAALAASHGHHGDEANGNGSSSKQRQQHHHNSNNNSNSHNNHNNQDDDEEDPLYCYCNRVSFGEMIACDADDCAREWFHLECVGLRVAPKTNVKWYCDDCKKRLKVGERKTNGR